MTLAGCGDDGDDASPTPTVSSATSLSRTTTTSSTAAEAEVLARYRAFWDAYLEAADPMDPRHHVLAEVATGESLQQLRTGFLGRLSAGEVIRGEIELAPRVVEIHGSSATVRDCYLDRTFVYDAETGARKDDDQPVRYEVTVRLVRDGSVWKVAEVIGRGQGCTAGPGY